MSKRKRPNPAVLSRKPKHKHGAPIRELLAARGKEWERMRGLTPGPTADIPLPAVQNEDAPLTVCMICGAVRASEDADEREFLYRDGLKGMSIDTDLCLECCVWLWAALKFLYSDQQGIIQHLRALFRLYPATAAFVPAFGEPEKGAVQ